jgi:hypothetical protein
MSPNNAPPHLGDPATPLERPKSKRRYMAGMLIYGVLAVLAGVTLDGNIRLATWIFLGGLALKTWLAVLKEPMG